ncbi:MAG: helicase-related protein [Nanoarchaeota archaeon]|nr:helicase-related protein [Nanoarchaeota archaeon]
MPPIDPLTQLALETIAMNKQAIIFAPSRASAEKTAEEISKLTTFNLLELEKEVLHATSTPTKQCRRLSHCLKKGIAFHHAGLVQKQRELIEDEFRAGKIKIICCTPTLAAGLSMPAFRVIIKSLKRYSGEWGMDWIPVLEYLQMAGRAGRPEYEKFGEAITLAKDVHEQDEIHNRYVLGVPEDIQSKLAVEPVLRTYLLSLISSGIIRDEKTMNEFFRNTFWAHQYEDMDKLEIIMDKMLSLLEKWKFISITQQKDMFVAANSLQNKLGKQMSPTLVGKRVAELYLDPLTARHLLDCMDNYTEKTTAFSWLQTICHTLEMRPLLRTKKKEVEYVEGELVKNYDTLLEPEPSAFDVDYPNFINSIKTTLFFMGWIDEKDEDYLMEKLDVAPGEIRVKTDVADWLLYAMQELLIVTTKEKEILKQLSMLRIRVQNGVREDVLPLLKLKGIGRVRARRLVSQGLKDLGDLKNVDITTLSQILGKAIAEDVKKQLGEEIDEVPDGKRKGQLSVMKF